MYLLLIETSGNQPYIFASNKLRESVGASELIWRVGNQWLLEAVAGAAGPNLLGGDAVETRKNLLDRDKNPGLKAGTKVEVVLATSGRGLVLTREKNDAQKILRALSRKALEEAPGLHVRGVIREFAWDRDYLDDVYRAAHPLLTGHEHDDRSPATRFLRLPVVAECRTTGLPAAVYDGEPPEPGARSQVSLAKRGVARYGVKRISEITRVGGALEDAALANTVDELEKEFEDLLDWVAVVHADGNGLGAIFTHVGDHVGIRERGDVASGNRHYVDELRSFSIAIDECTERAFQEAVRHVPVAPRGRSGVRAIVPVIVGGDDLTVMCSGRHALQFTAAFLREFEQATADTSLRGGVVPRIAGAALEHPRLSACAGVAIVKPHFPFHAAYDLAEDLIQSAKQAKRHGSAIDFHVLYDSSGGDLGEIRRKLERRDAGGTVKTRLVGRPYLVRAPGLIPKKESPEWAAFHDWSRLEARLTALGTRGRDGERCFPNSQAHWLREGLFLGPDGADARLGLIWNRYPDALRALAESPTSGPPTLFRYEEGIRVTSFLDAMDAVGFNESALAGDQP